MLEAVSSVTVVVVVDGSITSFYWSPSTIKCVVVAESEDDGFSLMASVVVVVSDEDVVVELSSSGFGTRSSV